MPQIRILESVSGTDFSWAPGDVVDLPATEASKWADGYRAELVRAERPERAVDPRPAETATKPKGRRPAAAETEKG